MPAPDRLTVLRTILDDGAVPTFTASDAATAFDMVAGCAAGGARVVEFTNRGDEAHATFVELGRRVRAELPQVILAPARSSTRRPRRSSSRPAPASSSASPTAKRSPACATAGG